MSERVIVHVDMNAFFASVEQRDNPHLRGKPIIVCGNPKSRTVVAACSYEAKALGITNGMSVFEARQLYPHVILVGGNPEKYVDAARRIFAICVEFTPQVEVFSIDEAFLDVTGTWRLFAATPEDLARLIKQRIREAHGLTCSIGIAPNKLLAKLASDLQKPDGLIRITDAHLTALLARLPVETLCGVGEHLKAHLNDLGIVTCADLGRAPASMLTARFGLIGASLKRMGQGVDERPVGMFNEEADVKSMGHAYTLPRDTEDNEEILGTLLRLCERVGRRLRADGYAGRTISLTVRYKDFSMISHARTIPYAVDSGLRIYQVARRLVEASCRPLPQRVRLLGVSVSHLTRHQRQLSFLEEELRLERLDRCLDRIADRFGECCVVRASASTPLTPKSHGFLLKHRRGLVLG
ncbi:MAG TPA: DNA polymerase IV [Candidatus Omnitrophica bacterium]|nr:MAG: hypothetical protein A2Z92_06270 [Omnitrophica WOR_2 bacterium GWA2_63_20]OGX36459.1 MAG: hypothetical protein A3B73_01110 [Omnitrophica WOR_2 bacterium RIFCSPHIGHO2_02_FULL_63_39]OGX44838.1 MAG: hypothetical protein A3I71_04225 [Omnitrophica WOR_2 bacterium RIFCSPLOWO2_02_FULL_63_16]OGX48069.1 MAG: hypothetical protein A3G88_01885 [Omnitrophica WOR_2 bacterium RIFCSPLOWO2_12_FULL_63_16]HAM41588.1 DNA polymerase IV [Candidatus Omnitrophota bacterium]